MNFKKRFNKIKNNSKGFSLVELIIAFAMLSIVSVSLLQMYVTSTKISKKSIDMDSANIIAQQAADSFKRYPDNLESSPMFSSSDTVILDNTFTKYYNSKWKSVNEGTAEVYRLEAEITTQSGTTVTQPAMHVNTLEDDSAGDETEYKVDEYDSYTLIAQSSELVEGVNIKFTGYSDIDSSDVINTIPVKVIYPYDSENPGNNEEITIDVSNYTGKNLIIYLFDDIDNNVEINKLAGLISVSDGWTTDSAIADKVLYKLDLSITKIEGNKEILSYTVNKYK